MFLQQFFFNTMKGFCSYSQKFPPKSFDTALKGLDAFIFFFKQYQRYCGMYVDTVDGEIVTPTTEESLVWWRNPDVLAVLLLLSS